jgi:hypothetical protein
VTRVGAATARAAAGMDEVDATPEKTEVKSVTARAVTGNGAANGESFARLKLPLEGETTTGVESVTARTVPGRSDDAKATPEKTTSTDASIKENKYNKLHTPQEAVK